MKKLIILLLISLFSNFNSFAIEKKNTDTIYVLCYQENLINKFYNTNQDKNQLRISYFFDVKWKLHGYDQSVFFFSYEGPSKQTRNEWSVPLVNSDNFKLYKNLYTLEQFTKALNSANFFRPIADRKVQIMMLYGEKCSTKFEMFPVKVGTDLSREG